MELNRLIFRVDFPPAFKLFTRWGEALELLNANKLWTQLGETSTRQIVAQKSDPEKGHHHNTIVEINNINGNVEEYPIKSLDSFERLFRDVGDLVQLAEVTNFSRVGTRFVFLEPTDSFAAALQTLDRQLRPEYLSGLRPHLTDMSIISVFKEEGQFTRINVGPVSKKEYPGWFSLPEKVTVENGILIDIDFYTLEYKFRTFDLRKFIDLGYDVAKKQATELLKTIAIKGA